MAACIAAIERALAQAEEQAQPTGRPLITLSYAQSLDGSLALARGAPLAISSPETRQLTHELRARHDAILVGIGTVLADDPRLNVRLVAGRDPQPVVLDSRLRLPSTARLLSGACKPWIFCNPGAGEVQRRRLKVLGAQVIPLPADPGEGLPLSDVLNALAKRGIRRVMVEGGARVITSFMASRLVDLAVITVAPVFAGGLSAVESPLAPLTGEARAGLPRLDPLEFTQVGIDLVVWGAVAYP